VTVPSDVVTSQDPASVSATTDDPALVPKETTSAPAATRNATTSNAGPAGRRPRRNAMALPTLSRRGLRAGLRTLPPTEPAKHDTDPIVQEVARRAISHW